MSGGCGGTGADSPAEGSSAEWRSIYDRVVALLPPVEELAADHARLKAVNKTQRELWEARENTLEARILQAEASRSRWKKAYIELSPGANPKLAELRENDLVDSKACDALFDVDNFQLKTQQKEARDRVEDTESCADHEDIPSNLRAELRKLKQGYETLSSKKDKEVSALLAVKEFLWNQLRTIDKENTTLEVVQKLQQSIEELQVVARKMDDQVGSLRAELDAKNKETSQECSKDIDEIDREEYMETSQECSKNIDEMDHELDGKYCPVHADLSGPELSAREVFFVLIPSAPARVKVVVSSLYAGDCPVESYRRVAGGITIPTPRLPARGLHPSRPPRRYKNWRTPLSGPWQPGCHVPAVSSPQHRKLMCLQEATIPLEASTAG